MSPWHYDALIDSKDFIPKKLDAILGKSYFSIGPLALLIIPKKFTK